MSLFSDIYNTVARFFRGQEEQTGDASKSVATNRLKLVLMQDRTNLTPRILEQMRGELIDLLSRYVELDKDLLDLNFEQEGSQVALMLSIPVIRAKDEDEIEAAIKEHNEAMSKNSSDDSDSSSDNTEVSDNNEGEYCECEDLLDSEKTSDSENLDNKNLQDANEQQIKVEKNKQKKVSAPDEMINNSNKTETKENVEVMENSGSEV